MSEQRLEIAVGRTHTERLAGLGSAGYSWNCTVEGAPSIVELTRESAGASAGSADELLHIRAVGPGSTRIRCIQRRLWETGQTPLREEIFNVEVTA